MQIPSIIFLFFFIAMIDTNATFILTGAIETFSVFVSWNSSKKSRALLFDAISIDQIDVLPVPTRIVTTNSKNNRPLKRKNDVSDTGEFHSAKRSRSKAARTSRDYFTNDSSTMIRKLEVPTSNIASKRKSERSSKRSKMITMARLSNTSTTLLEEPTRTGISSPSRKRTTAVAVSSIRKNPILASRSAFRQSCLQSFKRAAKQAANRQRTYTSSNTPCAEPTITKNISSPSRKRTNAVAVSSIRKSPTLASGSAFRQSCLRSFKRAAKQAAKRQRTF